MFWYVAHVKLNRASQIVTFFNKQERSYAFIPKKEQWYNVKGIKDYVIKDLYLDYVLIKSELNKEQFEDGYKDFFSTVDSFVDLLEYRDIYALKEDEQTLFEKLFGNGDVINHSVGNNINGRFIAKSGPLKGLEDMIIKVDRHHRFATLKSDLFNDKFTVPIEVVSNL